jgi:hypothetical protein
MMRSLLCLLILTGGCGDTRSGDDTPSPDARVTTIEDDPLAGLPTGVEQWQKLCARGYGDSITTTFCAGASSPPALTSLHDLQELLGLRVLPNPNNAPQVNPNVRLTLTGHSTGLGLRTVTPLNPRAFVMTTPLQSAPNARYQVMAFSRGEPFVELVANDPAAQTLRFFLVRFHLACEPDCTYGDLLGPGIERGWTGYTIYDEQAINNTTMDCLSCHQPGGPGTKKLLRMQELANPWAHWFYIEHAANKLTMDDYHAAHGLDEYAGIPGAAIDPSRPASLQRLVTNNGFGAQPNAFDTTKIETEMTMTGQSATWNQLYAKSVAGTEIPTPYWGTTTDPAKMSAAIAAYQQMRAGTLPAAQLPDIRDTLKDSALADMSIRPKPGLDGRGILVHMCRMCHNSSLDQTVSRAGFDIDRLDTLSRQKKDEAIARLQLPERDRRHMPPARFHVLSDAERALVIAELSK